MTWQDVVKENVLEDFGILKEVINKLRFEGCKSFVGGSKHGEGAWGKEYGQALCYVLDMYGVWYVLHVYGVWYMCMLYYVLKCVCMYFNVFFFSLFYVSINLFTNMTAIFTLFIINTIVRESADPCLPITHHMIFF